MVELQRWLGGILLGLVGLVGLYISAHAQDGAFSFFGLLLAVFSVLMFFRLIVLTTEAGEIHPGEKHP